MLSVKAHSQNTRIRAENELEVHDEFHEDREDDQEGDGEQKEAAEKEIFLIQSKKQRKRKHTFCGDGEFSKLNRQISTTH